MREQVLLVLDRAGSRWAVANGAVRSLERSAGRLLVTADGATISADRVLEVAARLSVRPAGQILAHYWPEPLLGVAVHEGVPVVVVSPGALPRALRERRKESSHVTRE